MGINEWVSRRKPENSGLKQVWLARFGAERSRQVQRAHDQSLSEHQITKYEEAKDRALASKY